MHKILILLVIMMITYNYPIFAAKPIANVPPAPKNYEVYTDNEDIYLEKYLEYYTPALMLQTQLKMMGVTNYPNIPLFSYEDLENMDIQKLKSIVKIANNLSKQVELLPDTYNPLLIDCEKVRAGLHSQFKHLRYFQLNNSNIRSYIIMSSFIL